jgi:urea transport system ATP-binding protein
MTMLAVENLSLHYGAAQALRGVSVEAAVGQVTCVLGRNGVGKTSLLRAIAGQKPISGGAIRFEGRDIGRLKPFERAALGIGFVPQGREIFPLLTVRENLETGFAPLRRGERRIPDEVFELFPVLKSMLGRRGGDLSGGQQQQLAIGRALVMRPRLLVLDEPSANLDPRARRELLEILDGIDRTMLVVTHDLPFAAQLCERAVLLSSGRVVADGPCLEVLDDEPLLAAHDLELPAGFDLARVSYAPAHGRRRDAPALRLHGGGHDPQVAQVRR